MPFIQFSRQLVQLSLKKTTEQTISLIVTLTSDLIMVIKSNCSYQIISIRSSEIIVKGSLPNGFTPSQSIQFLVPCKQKCLYLTNNEATICKFWDYYQTQNTTEVRNNIIPIKPNSIENFSIQYRILDKKASYLLGWAQNIQNMSCNLFIYDWVEGTFSNTIDLGSNFFNFIISNLSHSVNGQFNQVYKPEDVKAVLVAQDEKKIYYNRICFEPQPIQSQTNLKSSGKRIKYIIKQAGRRNFVSDHYPKSVYFQENSMYLLTNHKQGIFLLVVDTQLNNFIKINILIDNRPKKDKGFIRKSLGFFNQNLILTTNFLSKKSQQIFSLPIKSLQSIDSSSTSIKLIDISEEQKIQIKEGTSGFRGIQASIDGTCFNKFVISYNKVAKMCAKEGQNFSINLVVDTSFIIPKAYFYSELATKIGCSNDLTHEILKML